MEEVKMIRVFRDTLFNNRLSFLISSTIFALSGIILFSLLSAGIIYVPGALAYNEYELSYQDIVYNVSLLLIIISLVILLVANRKKVKRQFYLYDDRVCTKYKGYVESEIFFTEMNEIYRFRMISKKGTQPYGVVDSLAYRAFIDDPWIVIPPFLKEGKTKNSGQNLIDYIVNAYTTDKLDKTITKLKKSKVISFEYIYDETDVIRDEFDRLLSYLAFKPLRPTAKSERAINYDYANSETILLFFDGIILDDLKVTFERGDSLSLRNYDIVSNGTDLTLNQIGKKFFIYDNDKRAKCIIDLTCLVNSNLFYTILSSIYSQLNYEEESFEFLAMSNVE